MNDQICPTQKGRNLGFFAYQRLLENMGLIEKSSVTAYLEEYYEKHPLDNSYEGILARKSGLTKNNVIALLDYAEQIVFLAYYNPANLYPIPYKNITDKRVDKLEIKNNNYNKRKIEAVLPRYYKNSYKQRNYLI